MTPELLFKEEVYRIMGACFEVYKDKGAGFVEAVFQECLELEFKHLGLPAVPKPSLPLFYRGHPLKQTFEPDFVCFGKIILELKAVSKLADEHRAQVMNYLKASGLQLGLLVNMGHFPRVEWERIACSEGRFSQNSRPDLLA
jgi:GxxExxY protein